MEQIKPRVAFVRTWLIAKHMDAKFNIYLKRLAFLEFRPESSALYFHVFTLPLFYVPYDFRLHSLDLLF